MAGIYRQRHPERTVFYRVLFHYFEEFVAEYEHRFEREYGYLRPVIQEIVPGIIAVIQSFGSRKILTPTCTFFSQREEKRKKGSSINYPSLMRD